MKAFHKVIFSSKKIVLFLKGLMACYTSVFALDYHVSTLGSDLGDGSLQNPWRSLRYACSQVPANQGHRILLSSGTFVEAEGCKLPAGVSLIGAGMDQSILTASSSFYRTTYSGFDGNLFLLQLSGGQQLVEGISLDGQDKNVYGGVMVQNARNVELRNLRIQSFFFNGLWLWNTQNSSFHHSEVYDCSWGSSAWAGGAIHLYKLNQVALYDLQLTEIQQRAGQKGGGLALKALGPGNDNSLRDVEIYNCDVKVNPYGVWQNGVAPNISLEFWNVETQNCEIRNNLIRQHVSLVSITPEQSAPLPQGSYRVRLLQNQLLCEGSYPLEISMSNIEVGENYIDAGYTGYGIANWERRGTLYQNWYIHNNVFTRLGSGWPSSIIQTRGGLKNLLFENNTIHLEGPPVGIFSPYGPNTSENIQLRRNVIIRTGRGGTTTEPSQDFLIYPKTHEGVHYLSQVEISENIFFGFSPVISPYISGLTQEGNAESDPGLSFSGPKPFPFYEAVEGNLASQMKAGARFAERRDTLDPTGEVPEVSPDTLIRINAGGAAFISDAGEAYEADKPSYLSGTSRTYIRAHPIAGTEDDFLYQSERWGYEFGYHIPLPNGTYNVKLHFAEIYWKKEGIRDFDVNIEGGPYEVQHLDIYKEAGRFSAWVEEIPQISVRDGIMDIEFSTHLNNAKLSALEIIGNAAVDRRQPIRINSGSSEDLLVDGHVFEADTFYSDNSLVWENEALPDVLQTDWDLLYKSERYASQELGKFSYHIPVENGAYTLKVHFAEIFFGAEGGYPQISGEGRRFMELAVEEEGVLSDLDLAATVGPATAYVFEKELRVSDGELHLVFGASVDRPKVSAIEILPIPHSSIGQRKGQGAHFLDENQSPAFEEDINLYPNPSTQYTYLSLKGERWKGKLELMLFDSQGRKVSAHIFTNLKEANRFFLATHHLTPGLYLLWVQNSTENEQLKLLVK